MNFFNNRDDDDDTRDFFGDTEVPDKPAKEPKVKYKRDDPRYWAKTSSRWDHITPRRRGWIKIYIGGALVIVGLLIWFWLRYFSPFVNDAVQYGYVESIEPRGTVFTTYEGVLLPYKELRDTTRLYSRDFIFTAKDAKVATDIKRLMLKGVPVKVEYKKYHATLPWRGETKVVVTAVDSVDPRTILPPEFRPYNP